MMRLMVKPEGGALSPLFQDYKIIPIFLTDFITLNSQRFKEGLSNLNDKHKLLEKD